MYVCVRVFFFFFTTLLSGSDFALIFITTRVQKWNAAGSLEGTSVSHPIISSPAPV